MLAGSRVGGSGLLLGPRAGHFEALNPGIMDELLESQPFIKKLV